MKLPNWSLDTWGLVVVLLFAGSVVSVNYYGSYVVNDVHQGIVAKVDCSQNSGLAAFNASGRIDVWSVPDAATCMTLGLAIGHDVVYWTNAWHQVKAWQEAGA